MIQVAREYERLFHATRQQSDLLQKKFANHIRRHVDQRVEDGKLWRLRFGLGQLIKLSII